MLYHPNSQQLIPLFIQSALAGEFKPFESVVAQTLGVENALSTGLFLSVTCAEDIPFISKKDILRETNGTFLGARMVQSLVDACGAWTKGTLPAKYNEPIKSKVPVLIFSGSLDPMTPPVYGNEVARHLPNSRHIIMNGIAHNPFHRCAIGVMGQFIAAGSVTQLDVSCIDKLSRPVFATSFPGRR
jgi:pimeloyl-ACP methyl ester carboxylesterase